MNEPDDAHDLELEARGRRPRAALAAVLVRDRARELDLVHQWLDTWGGLGLVVAGMSHQGFTVSLGEHGVGRWIAVFFHGRGGHEPVAPAGTAQESTPCAASRDPSTYSTSDANEPVRWNPHLMLEGGSNYNREKKQMISYKDLYGALIQLVVHAEGISWNRLYNFLMGNSILVLAWATVYASNQRTIITGVVLSTICVLGGLSGIAWADLGDRTRSHLEQYFKQACDIEKGSGVWEKEVDEKLWPFTTADAVRKTANWYSTSQFLLRAMPLGFSVLYGVMLVATWCGK